MSPALEARDRNLISLLVAGHVAAVVVLLELRDEESNWIRFAWVALRSAQLSLLAIWVGCCEKYRLHRWGALAALIVLWAYLSSRPGEAGMLMAAGPSAHVGMLLLMLYTARFFGLHLVKIDRELPTGDFASKSGRLGLSDAFAIVTSATLIGAAFSFENHVSFRIAQAYVWAWGPHAVTGLASVWAALGGSWPRRTLLLLVCAAIVGSGQWVVTYWGYFDWLIIYRGIGFASEALVICASLLAFRQLGYRISTD